MTHRYDTTKVLGREREDVKAQCPMEAAKKFSRSHDFSPGTTVAVRDKKKGIRMYRVGQSPGQLKPLGIWEPLNQEKE